jgi:putative colanic acid biosynthesis acetyltransferase WcaF
MNQHDYQRLDQFKLPPDFRGRSVVVVQLWWLVQSTFFAWSPQFLYGWRRFLLRLFGANIGKNVLIRPSARVTYPWKLTLGDHCWVGDQVELYTLGNIQIGAHAVISQRSYICTGSHDISSPAFDIYAKPIVIEEQAWVAADVFVAPGVTIGRGTVVGARSTVLHDLPAGKICYGNPATVIKDRIRRRAR